MNTLTFNVQCVLDLAVEMVNSENFLIKMGQKEMVLTSVIEQNSCMQLIKHYNKYMAIIIVHIFKGIRQCLFSVYLFCTDYKIQCKGYNLKFYNCYSICFVFIYFVIY